MHWDATAPAVWEHTRSAAALKTQPWRMHSSQAASLPAGLLSAVLWESPAAQVCGGHAAGAPGTAEAGAGGGAVHPHGHPHLHVRGVPRDVSSLPSWTVPPPTCLCAMASPSGLLLHHALPASCPGQGSVPGGGHGCPAALCFQGMSMHDAPPNACYAACCRRAGSDTNRFFDSEAFVPAELMPKEGGDAERQVTPLTHPSSWCTQTSHERGVSVLWILMRLGVSAVAPVTGITPVGLHRHVLSVLCMPACMHGACGCGDAQDQHAAAFHRGR